MCQFPRYIWSPCNHWKQGIRQWCTVRIDHRWNYDRASAPLCPAQNLRVGFPGIGSCPRSGCVDLPGVGPCPVCDNMPYSELKFRRARAAAAQARAQEEARADAKSAKSAKRAEAKGRSKTKATRKPETGDKWRREGVPQGGEPPYPTGPPDQQEFNVRMESLEETHIFGEANSAKERCSDEEPFQDDGSSPTSELKLAPGEGQLVLADPDGERVINRAQVAESDEDEYWDRRANMWMRKKRRRVLWSHYKDWDTIKTLMQYREPEDGLYMSD